MLHFDKSGNCLMLLDTVPTGAVMKTLAVTACGGPAKVTKSVKGAKVAWTITT